VDARLEFAILGPLQVRAGGRLVHVGGPRQRALLALLLCHVNRVVSRDELIEELLAGQPAGAAERMLRVQISRLRKALVGGGGPPRLLARPPGYLLRVKPGELDLQVFEQRLAAGRLALGRSDPGRAVVLLGEAESLWRGRPLADLEFESFARFEIQRLEADRLAAVEDRIEAQLALGQHGAVSPELGRLVAEHPLRERLRGQLMVALYRSGRQAEALETYRTGRLLLVEELGVEPGPGLCRVHEQVLAADTALDLPASAGTVIPAGRPAPVAAPRELPAGVGGFTGRAAGSDASRGVFVGRTGELAVLEAAAAAARRGEPQVVLVEGEAGAGKSSLLARFAAVLAGAVVLRASGDEAELLLPYGIVGQLTASARGAGGPPGLLATDLSDRVDPLAVGADLVVWLGVCCRGQQMVLAVIDDLHWADAPSARALLFAVRRLQADRVLVVVSARPGELSRLGEGWLRFLAGDYRAGRVRLGGLGREEVVALGQALGAGELPRRAVSGLLEETGGNPLFCRAVLEEAVAGDAGLGGGPLRVPRSLAGMVLSRVGALSPAARELVAAAAVLGRRCELAAAAALASLDDPLPAMGEALTAGILDEEPGRAAAGIGFTHLLVHRAVYEDLSPARRRQLHQRAAGLLDRRRALGHRVAAATGPDDALAAELEAAGREAAGLGRAAQAASWLAQAAAVSGEPAAADRRLLDALEIHLTHGEVAQAEALAAQMAAAGPDARRNWLLGMLDFHTGRLATGEARLREAWQAHDRVREPSVGAEAAGWMAGLCLETGRIGEAIEWGERAAGADAAPAGVRHAALGVLAIALFADGRGPEGLSGLAFLPTAPAEVPRDDTDTLVMRGLARLLAEDMTGGIADLSTAATRLRAGVPLRSAGQCLSYLAGAEYLLGSWDDAVVHAELAVSLAHAADRVWEFGFVHLIAAIVPAQRGDWETASGHAQVATEVGQALGAPRTIAAAAIAQAFVAMARGDPEGVTDAAAAVRAMGKAVVLSLLPHDWRSLEIEALISLGRLRRAETALAEMQAALSPAAPTTARVDAARLHGDLATATGHQCAAAAAFETAWRRARSLRVPLALARLEISDARRLRTADQPQAAIARLRSARQRLITLGARPYLQACDSELAAAGAPARQETASAFAGLTPAEQSVARLVATGRSNRQAAAELYVSVKTVEFHLRHIFDKLGIRSRKELISRIGARRLALEET
jgi:DNA-binding SARP family transcriptional activator/DNA-binding CsgD family transcriptional regulator